MRWRRSVKGSNYGNGMNTNRRVMVKAAARRLVVALTSREARGPELALARIILAALGVKLSVNLAEWAK